MNPTQQQQAIAQAAQDFIESETAKLSKLAKLLGHHPQLQYTSVLASSFKEGSYGVEKKISPSWSVLGFAILLLLIISLFWITLLTMLLSGKSPWPVIVGGLLFVSFLMVLIVRNLFFNKEYNYTIIVDKEGIRARGRLIRWTDIAETFVMTRFRGRQTNYFLVIFRNDNAVEKFDLLRLGTTDIGIARIIEFYKKKTAENPPR